MPKLAMISLYLPSGSKIGAGYQAHSMANAFIRHGWAVTMFSPCERPEDARYDHVVVPVGKAIRTFRFAWELGRRDWSGFDVVHAHGDDYWLWFRKPVHVRTMHGSCMNEAIHIPGLKEKLRMVLLGFVEMAAALVAHRTIAVSKNTQRSYPWIRQMIPNGVDLDQFKPGSEKEEKPTILFVGTVHNRKRGALLMKEFSEKVLPAYPEAQLWMVSGDAPAAPGITFWGRISEAMLTELYRKAWVFCLPSSYEGFGVPYIEAMACGTPVVATPNPGANEVLDNGKYGCISDPGKLGETLCDLLNDSSRRRELAEMGIERAAIFGWPTIIKQYQQVYSDLGAVLPDTRDQEF